MPSGNFANCAGPSSSEGPADDEKAEENESHEDETDNADEASSLRAVAESPLVFVSDQDRGRLRTYRELVTAEELALWGEIFGEFYL